MNLIKYLERVGLDESYARYAEEWRKKGMSVETALTQRCEDCAAIIKKHTTAEWRFQIHVIRCAFCQKRRLEKGDTEHEAQYVV